jgi:hypothetical protein
MILLKKGFCSGEKTGLQDLSLLDAKTLDSRRLGGFQIRRRWRLQIPS